MQRLFFSLILLLASPCWAQTDEVAVGVDWQVADGNGVMWTEVPYPPATGGMYFVDQDGGNDANDGFDPHGFALSTATYTHSTRTLTSSGAFTGYTHTGGDRTDVIYLYDAAGSGVADGWYVIESKTSNDALVLEAAAGLTGDDTSIASSNGPKSSVAAANALCSSNQGDQLLFQRGDEWTITSVTFPYDGASASDPQVYGAYGPLTDARPKIIADSCHAFRRTNEFTYCYFISLHLESLREDAETYDGIATATSSGGYLLFEDMLISKFDHNINLVGGTTDAVQYVTVRNSAIVDAYDVDGNQRAQGLFINKARHILVENNVFDYNGNATGGATPTIYSHNIYFGPEGYDCTFRGNIFSRAGSMAIKLNSNSGTIIQHDNLFTKIDIWGNVGNNISLASTSGSSTYLYNNVFVEGMGISGVTATGPKITNTDVGYLRNNFIGQKLTAGSGSFAIQYTGPSNGTDPADYVGVNNFDTVENVIYNQRAPIEMQSGSATGEDGRASENCTFTSNVITNTASDTNYLLELDRTDYMTFSGNNWYTTQNVADEWFSVLLSAISTTTWTGTYEDDATLTAPSFTDATRTSTTFATSHANGYASWDEWMADLRAQRKGDWDESIMAEAVNDYIREGFNMDEYDPDNPNGPTYQTFIPGVLLQSP